MRSHCVRERIELTPDTATEQFSRDEFFNKELADVCTVHSQAQLLAVMQRANFALRQLLGAVQEYAMCLYPGPYGLYGRKGDGRAGWIKRQTRKSSCFTAVHDRLIQFKGKPGLLTLTLNLIAAYGKSADELLQKPLYADW